MSMFLPYLVICVFILNNIEFPFPHNYTNQPNISLLSKLMFKGRLRLLSPLENNEPSLMTIPVLLRYSSSSKSPKVTSIFHNFYHTVETTQFNAKIAILRSDNGHEFQSHSLNEFVSSKGIVHQSLCAYTPVK